MTLAPQFAAAHVKHIEGCYLRYFANRLHVTDDLLHLNELVQRLDSIVQQTADVQTPLVDRLRQLGQEAVAIELALRLEYPPEANVAYLASRANQQMLLYARHLAGRPRFTRRLKLVARMIENLTAILAAMRALDQVYKNEDNQRNITLVESELKNVTFEASEIASVRSTSSRAELIRSFGASTNQELVDARKKKATMALDDLAGYCDRVGELAYQMFLVTEEPTDETDASINLANLRMATRALEQLEDDYKKLHDQTRFVSVAQVVASAPSLRAQLTCANIEEVPLQAALGRLEAFVADPLVRQLFVDSRAK